MTEELKKIVRENLSLQSKLEGAERRCRETADKLAEEQDKQLERDER